jgi:hypothetical protein
MPAAMQKLSEKEKTDMSIEAKVRFQEAWQSANI